jgi:hypothetical protein
MASSRCACLLPTSNRSSLRRTLPPTMPSADFCVAVRSPCDGLSPESGTQRRPPEVRSTAFTARPPDLPPRHLMTVDFAISCSLVRPGRPRYPVLVHRAAALLHASFRPRLATTPLRFANPSPPSGWIEDFHLQAVVHTRHTNKPPTCFRRWAAVSPTGIMGASRLRLNSHSRRYSLSPAAAGRWAGSDAACAAP